MKIGFDNEKYLKMQSEHIRQRIEAFGDKLYLEFGGKLFDDYHASRVLPGFAPDSKLRMLLQLADQSEIIIAISAADIEKNKVRQDLGITYDVDVLRLIQSFQDKGLYVGSVVITQYSGQASADQFKSKLEHMGIRVYRHYSIEGYPSNVSLIVSDEGYGKNDYIETTRPLVIVTAPGPGSGKTRVLVHKLASLLVREDVRSEQLLMLTFSRAAATEFKRRLIELVGKAAYFVDIKTFHSYAFDILGRYGSLQEADGIVLKAAKEIASGNAEPSRIGKTVLVIDEAQDMDASEAALVDALIEHNETLRVIAVGDDDQNIYAFRGADGRFMQDMLAKRDAVRHEMTENYRSTPAVVDFSNAFVSKIKARLKTHALTAVRNDTGSVRLVSHASEHFEEALVKGIISDLSCGKLSGSCAVLTNTNEEAFTLCAMLKKTGVAVSLIQSQKKRRCRQSCRGTRSTEIHDRTDARSKACFRASFCRCRAMA